MNTRQKLHQMHLNEWTSRFADQKASGLTIRQWSEQNNFSVHSYNYWKHILKEELACQMLLDIVPLTFPQAVFQHESIAPAASMTNSSSVSCLTNRATFTNIATLTINEISIQVGSDIPPGSVRSQHSFSFLWKIFHKDKRTPWGWRWFPTSLQACGKRTFLMAT